METHFLTFEFLKEHELQNVIYAENVLSIYNIIKNSNAFIVQPYIQGWYINELERQTNNNTLTPESIKKIFASAFFNLNQASVFMDGYYNRTPELFKYNFQLEYSFILCLQGDFVGAINTLLPVIEGTIRNFEVQYSQKKQSKIIGSDSLITGIRNIKERIIKVNKGHLNTNLNLDINQRKELLSHEKKYYDCWFNMFIDYFEKSLYLKTYCGEEITSINRHDVFHGFMEYKYYTFENYLKLYGCIQFLSWALLRCDPKNSIFAEIESKKHIFRFKLYGKIRISARETYKLKKKLMGSSFPIDDDFESFLFKK